MLTLSVITTIIHMYLHSHKNILSPLVTLFRFTETEYIGGNATNCYREKVLFKCVGDPVNSGHSDLLSDMKNESFF